MFTVKVSVRQMVHMSLPRKLAKQGSAAEDRGNSPTKNVNGRLDAQHQIRFNRNSVSRAQQQRLQDEHKRAILFEILVSRIASFTTCSILTSP